MADLGHWVTDREIPDLDNHETFFGFIYEITNTIDGRKYIGKKQAKTHKKYPPLKVKKKGVRTGVNRRIWKDTDWKSYTGSSKALNADIEEHGKDKFEFRIIRFCTSKSELAYMEAKLQFDNDVLLKEEYYNGILNLKLGKTKPFEI